MYSLGCFVHSHHFKGSLHPPLCISTDNKSARATHVPLASNFGTTTQTLLRSSMDVLSCPQVPCCVLLAFHRLIDIQRVVLGVGAVPFLLSKIVPAHPPQENATGRR